MWGGRGGGIGLGQVQQACRGRGGGIGRTALASVTSVNPPDKFCCGARKVRRLSCVPRMERAESLGTSVAPSMFEVVVSLLKLQRWRAGAACNKGRTTKLGIFFEAETRS